MKRLKLILAAVAFCAFCASTATAHEVVLDPGHSSSSPGAKSCFGVFEHVYNSNLTATIVDYLAAHNIRVDVTRTADGELSLLNRARMAAGKKLFLSLHHDSAQPQFISYASGNPCSAKAQGYSIFVSAKNSFFQESLACARILGKGLFDFGLRPSTHHGEAIKGENRKVLDEMLGIYQFDELIVLKSAAAPALLLEAAVIIHPHDEARAVTKAYQVKIAAAVAQTIIFAVNNLQ